jgi:hypothetical protein
MHLSYRSDWDRNVAAQSTIVSTPQQMDPRDEIGRAHHKRAVFDAGSLQASAVRRVALVAG